MMLARHTSPDETLTLIIEQIGDDVHIGFEGMPWHTHGDILAQLSSLSLQSAVERFVEELLHGQHVLALLRRDGALVDAWVTDDPAKDASYTEPGEVVEFRYWDGTQVQPQQDSER
jgi:hypothetical protein